MFSFLIKKIANKLFSYVDGNQFISKIKDHTNTSLLKHAMLAEKSVIHEEANIVNMQNRQEVIKIGNHSHLRGELVVFRHGGKIEIGDFCFIGVGSKIWSSNSILIKNRVLISHNVNIHDNNGHPIDPEKRHNHYKKIIEGGFPEHDEDLSDAPILIEDDVWIGFNAIILKGVIIGKGAIVASGTVVTKNVDNYTIVAGNPMKVIKRMQK